MPNSTPPDSLEFRYQVVQGYDRLDLHPDVVRSIRWYISTGDPNHLSATTYEHRRKILLKEQRGK
jgi:hypothetical protein